MRWWDENIGREAVQGRCGPLDAWGVYPMIALSLTIFVSLGLAVFFVGLFLIQEHEGGGKPHDALLPLEGECKVHPILKEGATVDE